MNSWPLLLIGAGTLSLIVGLLVLANPVWRRRQLRRWVKDLAEE
jgi:uncharacterized membrane protein HdeD (DUF308 family)